MRKELLRKRATRLGDDDLCRVESGQQVAQLIGVALLVQHVGREHEIPAGPEPFGLVPARDFGAEQDPVSGGVRCKQIRRECLERDAKVSCSRAPYYPDNDR